MKRVLFALVLLLVSVGICTAEPKVACIYSQFLDYAYKPDHTQLLASIGWSQDLYENTHIKELISKLNSYDMVIGNSSYNYSNSQDLTVYGKEIREYIEKGGCLVITDANYPPHTQWLTSIDPNLVWSPSNQLSNVEGQPLPWANTNHPLTAGLPNPTASWTYPIAVSPYITPLYKYANGATAVGVMEIGNGAVVITTMYHPVGWPTAGFLQNLLKWVKDPQRQAKAREQYTSALERTTKLPTLNIPMISSLPTIDGKIGTNEWDGAAIIPSFYDRYGRDDIVQSTKCRIARTQDDIVILFECSETSIDKLAKGVTARDGQTWDNDSVEVFLDPTGTRDSYYQFAVGCSGAQYDGIGWSATRDSYWEAKTSIGEKGWIAEIRIPISCLGKDGINSKGAWAGNFNRFARPNGAKELSGWSPINADTFHKADRFGTLTGVSTTPANYPFSPDIQIVIPNRWYRGSNDVTATISKLTKSSSSAVLQLIDLTTGNVVFSKDIPVSGESKLEIKCNVNLESTGLREMQFVLSDTPDRHRILASSPVFRPEAAPDFTMNVILPVVRGTIQSKDRVKKLAVDGTIGYDSTDKLYIECQGVDANGKIVSSARRRVYGRKDFSLSTDLERLPVGKYQFTYKLLENDKEINSQIIPLVVAPPAATEVSFDDKHVCYVNGKPFFPIGLYHVTKAAVSLINNRSRPKGIPDMDIFRVIKELKDRGFNTVINSWGMPDDEYMKYTQSLGLWVMPEVGAPTKENVEMANRYTNLLMWYGADEPSGERLKMIKAARDQTALLDPNRPVSAAVCNPSLFKDALAGFDFLMMDPYLIRSSPLAGIGDWIKRGMDAGNGTKPVWLVPQAFTIDSPVWNEPTPEELKCQAYIGLVHGATGLLWYAFFTTEDYSGNALGRGYWVLSDSKLWDAFPKLNAEINTLAPIVLTGLNRGPSKCTSPDVHTCIWKYRGKSYLLAVNTLYKPVKCTIKGMGEDAEVMFENKKVVTEDGILKASFKPLEVHVYKF